MNMLTPGTPQSKEDLVSYPMMMKVSFKVNISNDEVNKLIKEYKKIKKNEKSNFSQIKKLGLVDKFGKPLS